MIILDTHVLIWMTQDSDQIGQKTRDLIDAALANDELLVSAISFWEIVMFKHRKQVEIAMPLSAWRNSLLKAGVREIPICGEVGLLAVDLNGITPDPADRMIAASAILQSATMVTADDDILAWTGNLKSHDARL
jgi:PIN domain nuclease of toxin-antitoxin system